MSHFDDVDDQINAFVKSRGLKLIKEHMDWDVRIMLHNYKPELRDGEHTIQVSPPNPKRNYYNVCVWGLKMDKKCFPAQKDDLATVLEEAWKLFG